MNIRSETSNKISEQFIIYRNQKEETAKKVLEILKKDCTIYGELEAKLNHIKRSFFFQVDGQEKFEDIFKEISNQLNGEKNALPLTKHS